MLGCALRAASRKISTTQNGKADPQRYTDRRDAEDPQDSQQVDHCEHNYKSEHKV